MENSHNDQLTTDEKIIYAQVFRQAILEENPDLINQPEKLNAQIEFCLAKMETFNHDEFLSDLGIDSDDAELAKELGLNCHTSRLKTVAPNYSLSLN